VKVDVRVIAATNKPLEKAVAAREFREDLFYRLNVVRIQMPPLRERSGDIRLLVNYFLGKIARQQNRRPKSIAPEALTAMERHTWPGNVRELENAIQRAIVVAKGDVLLPADLPSGLAVAAVGTPSPTVAIPGGTQSPATGADVTEIGSIVRSLFAWARRNGKLKLIPAVERELIVNALAETGGNLVQAARLLGITRATLRKRVEKFQIKREISVQ
jgi:two-component system nitrogen regulation response regulator GlnG